MIVLDRVDEAIAPSLTFSSCLMSSPFLGYDIVVNVNGKKFNYSLPLKQADLTSNFEFLTLYKMHRYDHVFILCQHFDHPKSRLVTLKSFIIEWT